MEIIAIVLSNVAAVGVVGYLLRLWIEKRLSHSLDLELSKFRADLAKEVARDSIQQTWNTNKRMELFAQLYPSNSGARPQTCDGISLTCRSQTTLQVLV